MNPAPHRHKPQLAAARLLAPAALIVVVLSGCSRPLLSSSDERTPFDRYDAIRNQYARQYIENEFGHSEPNLRGRLAPK